MTQDKIKEILDTLNNVQENLLALPDDMLLNIDPRDNESLEKGTQFIQEFNETLDQFTNNANTIEKQIKEHFGINPEEEDVEKETQDRRKRDRIIKELDKTTPHYLNEDFTYKRPYGFVLQNTAYKGLKTWKNLYLHVLNILYEKAPEQFGNLPHEEKFISKRGNPLFSKDKSDLRVAETHDSGLYVEINMSANKIRETVQNLLEHFNYDPSEMKIYLREDRDASA